MKSLFDNLKKNIKVELVESTKKFSSAKDLMKTLESTYFYSDLTVRQVNALIIWGGVSDLDLSINDMKFGDKFLKTKRL